MAHQRKTIREKVKALLVAASTAAGSRVYENRSTPWLSVELPAIAIFTSLEHVDPESKHTAPRELDRNLELVVDVAVENTDNADDTADALAEQVEAALDSDPTWGDTVSDSILSSTEMGVLSQGNKQVGYLRMTYAVRYFTYPAGGAVDDLKTVDTRYRLAGLPVLVEDTFTRADGSLGTGWNSLDGYNQAAISSGVVTSVDQYANATVFRSGEKYTLDQWASARILPVTGLGQYGSIQSTGIAVRHCLVGPDRSFYGLTASVDDGVTWASLGRYVAGMETPLAAVDTAPGHFSSLGPFWKLEVRGPVLTAFDGPSAAGPWRQLMSVTDNTIVTSGAPGITVLRGDGAPGTEGVDNFAAGCLFPEDKQENLDQ